MLASLVAAESCPAISYPRTLHNVLDAEDRQHLTNLYFEKAHQWGGRRYYNLLHHLAADGKDDELAWHALEAVRSRIQVNFGEDFVIINDFFSYRSASQRLFPSWHQDGEFWLADDGTSDRACRNFNLWILLDHCDMNHSFELVEPALNEWFYGQLNARHFGSRAASFNFSSPRAWFMPQEAQRLSRMAGLRGFIRRDDHRTPTVSRVPLRPGDALIVKQIELHRTDDHPLRPEQWRLALGFKVLVQGAVLRLSEPTSPFGNDAGGLRALWPGLLPEFVPGSLLPLVYNRSRLARLDPADERPGWRAYLHTEHGLVLLAPAAFLALTLIVRLAARRDARCVQLGNAPCTAGLPLSRPRDCTARRDE